MITELDWSEYGLAGAVIGSLFVLIVGAARSFRKFTARLLDQQREERREMLEQQRTERAETLEAHRKERDRWQENDMKKTNRMAEAFGGLKEAIIKDGARRS